MKYPITPDYLAAVPEPLISLYQGLEEYIIQKICESLRISGEPNATALELIRELQRRGMPLEDIEKRIRQVLNISSKELDQIFDNAVQRNNTYYQAAYDKLGLIQEEAQLEEFAQEIETISRQTHAMMQNITRSMGFGMRGTDGQIVVSDIQETYQRILNKAEIKVLSGAESYNVAIRDGIREMTDSGLIGEWVEYRDEQGEVYHRNRVDVAVRRAVMTGVTQVSSWRAEQAAEDLETPYREISAHRGARDVDGPNGWENHKKWQGKVYSLNRGDKYPYIYTATGWGDVTGLEGANCRHMHFPFIEGFSERTYTDEELANIDKAPFTYQGRQYNAYQATQKQRQIEAALRNVKRRMVAFKASGDDEAYTAAAVRYRRLNEEYEAFSETAELPLQSERGNIPEFGPKEAKEAFSAAIPQTGLFKNSGNTGIFSELPEKMSRKHIRELAKEFDISLKGVKIIIDRDPHKLEPTFPFIGWADAHDIGRIDFYPKAFVSKEMLLRTLYHEKTHVNQFREYGGTYVELNREYFEELADAAENAFIAAMKEAKRL